MRPRPDAAENTPSRSPSARAARRFNEAAARCRGKPAQGCLVGGRAWASMRPRPDAAENATRGRSAAPGHTRFNEAAARCRGKHRRPAPRPGSRRPASMRPRPDAAENRSVRIRVRPARSGFNEAAARCRGKHGRLRRRGCNRRGFNEAAARCRGKRVGLPPGRGRRRASMRPRPDAAENFHQAISSLLDAISLQ